MSIVPLNTTTGEIVGRDPQSVVDFLENAKWMLDAAVEMTGPAEVALIKAQVVMADTYARELALSKDIQEQAQEMVRRAEYSLGRAYRKGQQEGTVTTRADGAATRDLGADDTKISGRELFGNRTREQQFSLEAADLATPEEFDAAIEQAKAEGDLSRSNVGRKVRKESSAASLTRQQRADLIAELAEQGMSSRQMPARVGVTEETVRQIARDFDIEIPADRVVGRTRRIDHTDVVSKTVIGLEDVAEFIQAHIDLNEVDFSEADEWVSSLNRSITAITKFKNTIKEKTHV